MPTEEEYIAIMALAMKAHTRLKHLPGTEEQVETVRQWAEKWMKLREYNRNKAKVWNKAHPDEHRKHCREYARRVASKTRAYQAAYYTNVTKPKRQGEKGDK